jgi:Tfp pilus assembly protein PilN
MRAFNLLSYPALASQRRKRHRLWTSLAGLALGSVLAVSAAQMVQNTVDRLEQERHRLQAQLTAQQALWGEVQKNQLAQQKWQVQSAHLAQIQRQHARWQALHQALQNEMGPGSVQLMRLQLEAKHLELHGNARDVQRMDEVRHALSAHLAQHLPAAMVLSSLVVLPSASIKVAAQAKASAPTLEFVWQSVWPEWSDPVPPGSAAKSSSPTGRVLP